MLISRLLLLSVLFLAACSVPVRAITDYVQFNRGSTQAAVARTPLDNKYKYLLVTVKGKSFLMAQGAIEASPEGPVEVWFSGNREVLRIRNGWIIAAVGTPVEWSDVHLSADISWDRIKAPVTLERRRDVMPGFHFGLADSITISPTAAPSGTQFFGPKPSNLSWFEETSDSDGSFKLPPSRYAVNSQGDTPVVIYGEQCLSKSLCFSWQRWPTPT